MCLLIQVRLERIDCMRNPHASSIYVLINVTSGEKFDYAM